MNYSDLHKALDEAAYEVLQNYQKRMYRIEKRSEMAPTLYWRRMPSSHWNEYDWDEDAQLAAIYTEAEREAYLQRELRGEPNRFPEGGIWVKLEEPRIIECADCGQKLNPEDNHSCRQQRRRNESIKWLRQKKE